MAAVDIQDIHVGWKVFIGAEEVGTVSEVRDDDLGVERGALIKHVEWIPKDEIAEAGEGIVDLRVDGEAMALLRRN